MSERSPKQSGKSALGFAEGRVARDAWAAGRGNSHIPVRHLAIFAIDASVWFTRTLAPILFGLVTLLGWKQ
jgi:hypothetical protein